MQRGAVDAEQFGGFADVARGKFQRGGDIAAFLFMQMLIQVESCLAVAAALSNPARSPARARTFPSGQIRPAIVVARRFARVFGGEPDDDVAQFAGVAGKLYCSQRSNASDAIQKGFA